MRKGARFLSPLYYTCAKESQSNSQRKECGRIRRGRITFEPSHPLLHAKHEVLDAAYRPLTQEPVPLKNERNGARAAWLLVRQKVVEDVYTFDMRTDLHEGRRAEALFDLPCACQNLRRATRVVTRIYDKELGKAGIEITQFGLLTALKLTGGTNQKRLSGGFAMDSTTLTRTLRPMLKQGWIRARRGKDKRERLFSLTRAGRRQLATAQPFWEVAQRRIRRELGDAGWTAMEQAVSQLTEAALAA